MKKSLILTSALICVAAFAGSVIGQAAKTSDKELLIKASQILEAEPFHEKAKDFRAWATAYVIQTSDVNVVVCGGPLLEPLLNKKNKYGSELTAQYTIGMAAFKLADPTSASDENSAQLAGHMSMLRSYEAMVRARSKARFTPLDDLLAKRDSGELKKIIDEADCGGQKTEPLK